MKVTLACSLSLCLFFTSCAPDHSPAEGADDKVSPFSNSIALTPEKGLSAINQASQTGEFRSIVLNGYTCGDNCYLQYTPLVNGGHNQDALCTTPECEEWERLGELPDELIGQEALVKFSVAPQYDGAGNIMQEDFPSIVEIRIEKEKSLTDQ